MKRRLLPLVLAASVAACASVAQQENVPAEPASAPAPTAAPASAPVATPVPAPEAAKASPLPAQELTAQILYQFLLAEIAGTRGNITLAMDAYRDLARSTRDPRIAQRATQIALFARRYEVALDAARLWSELDPESAQARQMITSLLAAGARPKELAENVARQLAAEGPNLPNALLSLNRLLSRLPDKRQVLGIIEQVTTPYVGIAEAHFARAVAAHGAQDATRALGEAERAVALRPDWEQAVLLRSQFQSRPEAIEGLRRFVAEHRPSRDLRQALARLYVAERRYAEGRQEFVQLLAGAPDDTETIYALGVLSYQLQEPREAERHFRRLIELNYADTDSVRLYLGQLAEDDKRWDEAIKWYEKVGPGEQYVAARLRHANVLARQGKLDAALADLQAARAAHGEHGVKLLIGEAQLLREAGRSEAALAALDAGLAAQPDQPELLYESALAAERLGRIDIFESRLNRLLQLKPDHAHAFNALGYSLAERNLRLDEAQKLIEQAQALAPDDPFILDSKGWVLFRRGDAAGALDALQRAFAIRSDPEIAAHLGEVLWTLNRRDEAARIWAEANKAHPGNEVLTATIKRLQP
ncbi:MAG: tetratricopeptide repeat protein [Gammaproteobacteria bacterium]|nr:tetratricopeptide repeat protein [Gammaproteobacteria bacterium]MBU1972377.1 tetratricopeptide repeat protein [Gammaproteobacteria bacterium]